MKKQYQLALVTGGSSGIGLALAKALAKEGVNIGLLARDEARLAQAKEAVQALTVQPDQKVSALSVDITDYEALAAKLGAWQTENGLPDLVINSAGVTYPGYFEQLDVEIFHWLMDINYFGTLHVCKLLAPGMMEQGAGTIVNISSQAGFLGVFGYTGYCASKFAVRGFSDALRSELKPHGVQLSVVFPPDTQTPQLEFEDPLKPFETRELAGTVHAMSADAVAGEILKGVRKGKYVVIPGGGGKFFYRLTSILGNLTYPVIDMLVRQAQKKKKNGKASQ